MNLVCQAIRLSNKKKMELFTQCSHGEIYTVLKIVPISTEKITNLVINQHCLHFKCMKVNIFGKCIKSESATNYGIIQGLLNLYHSIK